MRNVIGQREQGNLRIKWAARDGSFIYNLFCRIHFDVEDDIGQTWRQ